MKIRVVHKDGGTENLTLTEPLTVERSESLNAIRTSLGMRFFFTEEGFYDGWEAEVSAEFPNESETVRFIQEFGKAVDADREIFPPA